MASGRAGRQGGERLLGPDRPRLGPLPRRILIAYGVRMSRRPTPKKNVAVLQRGSVAVWQSGSPVGTPGPVFENVIKEARLPPDGLRHNLKELPLHLSQVLLLFVALCPVDSERS